MNYYERHLGDYAKDTGHLTMLEHGAYTLLLDRYYGTETPIPADQAYRVARARQRDEREAVDSVLREFFVLTDDGWVNGRAAEEMLKAQDRIAAAKANGKNGGRPKKTNPSQTQEKPTGFPLGSNSETQKKAYQAPPNHLEEQDQKQGARPRLVLPDWLPADLWDQWHDFRNSRKGWTTKARELSLRSLTKLRDAGQDPRAVIEQSIERNWTGLFPVRSGESHVPTGTGGGSRTAIDRVQANIERNRRDRGDAIEGSATRVTD